MTGIPTGGHELVDVAIDSLKPYPHNPREHPERQLQMLEASIRAYGFNNPLLLAPDLSVIAGHGRLLAARRLGMTHVPAIVLPHLDEAMQRAYRVADNQLALKGEWSFELLRQEVAFVMELDIEPLSLGFETPEVDILLLGPNGGADESGAAEAVPDVDRDRAAVSRPGDLWSIGRHKVLCGDARQRSSYELLLGTARAAAVISDMPFNVPVQGHVGGLGKVRHPEFPMASGEMSRPAFKAFMAEVFRPQAAFSAPGALNFQFIDWRSVGDMIAVGEEVYDTLVNICVWVKPSGGMGSLWRSRHELVCVFRAKGGKHVNNVMLGRHGRNRTNVWEYAAPSGFGPERDKLELHPTCKNVDMIADAVLDCTRRGDVVLDAFLGSGTTLLAAARTGRAGHGIELDPYYVDLAVTRLAEATGQEARLADGTLFSTVRENRAGGHDDV
ncbi:site-specific DNA-methyltransferase [Sphingosinicella microcystinivorans]|uniref:site-specific DNA-methyltransferase n=1 Tax=Sphingosinicella microcystinivorans TaxID=335406 RepID=UPI0022F39848|nr:DNA methyltransferase [Sphingosinicella microcystinivorans]WBX86204.1 site-specific DNA-methyltransferase [Sphingosinicella microcystinivorans]